MTTVFETYRAAGRIQLKRRWPEHLTEDDLERAASIWALEYLRLCPDLYAEYIATQQQEEHAGYPPITFTPTTNHTAPVVYVIRMEGPELLHKIGRSFSGEARRQDLQVANPYLLRLVGEIRTEGASALETQLKKRYAAFRRRGEWFDLPLHTIRELYGILDTYAQRTTTDDFRRLV